MEGSRFRHGPHSSGSPAVVSDTKCGGSRRDPWRRDWALAPVDAWIHDSRSCRLGRVALFVGVLGGIGLWAAAKVRAGGTSKSRFVRALVKGFLPYYHDAMGKTGEEFWAGIRAKTK